MMIVCLKEILKTLSQYQIIQNQSKDSSYPSEYLYLQLNLSEDHISYSKSLQVSI